MGKMRFKDDDGKQYPQIHFGTLEDISFASSSSISQESVEKDFGKYPIYGANGEIKRISTYEKDKEYIAIVKDGAGVGRVIIGSQYSSIIGTMNYIENKENCDLRFLFYLIKIIDFSRYVVGSGIPHIYFRDYKKEKICIPSLKEQEKIGGFLSSFDELIQKQQEKINLSKELKKGYLQKIYDQEIQFHDEFGSEIKWEKRKLSSLGVFSYGKSAPKWSISDDAEIECVRYGELYSTYDEVIQNIVSKTNINRKNLVFSSGKEVLIPRVGEDPLDFANCSWIQKSGVAIGEMIAIFKTTQNPLFMTYLINQTMRKVMAKVVEGGNVSNLYYKYYMNHQVEIPPIFIQEKISSLFRLIDSIIKKEEDKLKYQLDLKKGYMQRLFAKY